MMDTTYKTNKYRLSLLEIVRVTSTMLTFSSERQSNFTWALERLGGLFMTSKGGPQLIVSDRDLTLMNDIATVFLECYHLLCRFNIHKNVRAKRKMLVNFVEAWDVVMEAWENVMYCEDESTITDCVKRLRHVCILWPLLYEYVNESGIISYKKFFVKAMTNWVMHLGNTTSNKYVSLSFWLVIFGYLSYDIVYLKCNRVESAN